jgi:hypothetical protein
MARKALLVGSETGGLTGVGNDVTAMADSLMPWGFSITRCENENASRAGILDSYERLIKDAAPDDTVIVYYSGHGGYSPEPPTVPPASRTVQFIVPTDYELSVEGDFRGITSAELSVLLARLTERTRNVTVVLDCCHAAHMSRDPGVRVKAIDRAVSHHVLRTHVDSLERQGVRLDLWNPRGNPYAVRIVACSPVQAAYESPNADGVRMGYLTDALTRTLADLRTSELAVSWSTVMDRVRQRVTDVRPGQRPEAEGPAQRFVFDTAEADVLATLPVAPGRRGRVRIGGARLFGLRAGDELVVVAGDGAGPGIGSVTIDVMETESAWGPLEPQGVTVPLDARAQLVNTTLPALPVRADETDLRLTKIVHAFERTPLLEAAPEGRVSVEAGPDGVVICDLLGPLHAPRPVEQADEAVVNDLKRIARAQQLRTLSAEPGLELCTPVTVVFSEVVNGETRPLPHVGAVLHPGEAICVEVRNEGDDAVYASLIDIGVSSRTTVLNPSSPSGVLIEPREKHVFGLNEYTGSLQGMTLDWPESIIGDQPRTEAVMVLLSEEPVDTHVLAQDGIRGHRGRLSHLERKLARLGDAEAEARELRPSGERPARFTVRMLEFDLVPAPAPVPEAEPFEVDCRASRSLLLWHEPSAEAAEIAIELSRVTVHHDSERVTQGLRLDVLVVADDEQVLLHTQRFAGVAGGTLLPGDIVVCAGEVRGRVDIAVWASSDGGEPALTDLLDGRSAGVVDRAGALLRQTCRDTVGLYRTTLLDPFGSLDSVVTRDLSFRCSARVL